MRKRVVCHIIMQVTDVQVDGGFDPILQKFKSRETEVHFRRFIQHTNNAKRAISQQAESPSIRYRETASYNPISNEPLVSMSVLEQSRQRDQSRIRSTCGRRILEQSVIENHRQQRKAEYRQERKYIKNLAQLSCCMIPVKTNYNIINNEQLFLESRQSHAKKAWEKLSPSL